MLPARTWTERPRIATSRRRPGSRGGSRSQSRLRSRSQIPQKVIDDGPTWAIAANTIRLSAKAPTQRQRLRNRRPFSKRHGGRGHRQARPIVLPATPREPRQLSADLLGLQARTRRISPAICSPRSSCRKCAAPSIFTCSRDGRDPVDEALARLADTGRRGRCRRRRPAPASPSGRERRRPRASRVAPAASSSDRDQQRELRGARPWTRRSGRARRRPATTSSGSSVVVAALDHEADGQVGVLLGEVAPGHEALGDPAGEEAGVEDRQRADPIGVLDRPAQADRPAPVLDDDDRVREVERRPAAS